MAWVLAYSDDAGKRHKPQFPTKREADAARVEIEDQLRKGTFRDGSSMTTVQIAADDYISGLEENVELEELTRFYYMCERANLYNYVCSHDGRAVSFTGGIANVKLSKCTPNVVRKFRKRMKSAGVSTVTQRSVIATLSRTFDDAISRDNLVVNPAKGVRILRRKDELLTRVTPPRKSDFLLLTKHAVGRMKLEILFAGTSGLRASEHHGLIWENVDLENGEVLVCQSLDRYGKIKFTKSVAGVRTVPLGSDMVRRLAAWKQDTAYGDDEHPVFPNSRGGFMAHNNFLRRQYRPLQKEVAKKAAEDGQTYRVVTWHPLRHFSISCWIEIGLQPKTVQTFAGHSSLQVTMDRYGHLFPQESHRDAMDQIAREILVDGACMEHAN